MTPAELAKKRGESTSSDQGEDLNRDAGGGTAVLRPRAPHRPPAGLRRRSCPTGGSVAIGGNAVDINADDLVPGNLKKDIFKQCVLTYS